ncbi:4-hydroxybenzoate 3-monooxygenase [Lacisediminihabitans sp. H27-G8]|uniref:4-hydroxybenzoate 3-monooxygenase n=1 Tax=Lacisediminihabitans sp. H27-G8 TaxID=3111909 RepID=UPI0038FD1783
MKIRTTVAIVGAGPAGLLLGHLLAASGIDFVIIEARSREYILSRIRAGVLEESSVDVLASLGLDGRLREHGLVHDGIYLQYEGARHHVDFSELIGRTVTVYGQQQVVNDLMLAHDEAGSAVYFESSDVLPQGIETPRPSVDFVHGGRSYSVDADFVIGADGFHGVCRSIIPSGAITSYQREYPFAWLGILADVPPSTDELIYALHPEGFAMHSMRSPAVSRLYLQVEPDDDIANWSDERIWEGLHERLGVAGWTLREGEITEKSITPMRSFVASTLNHGALFLVGDAGHIVPPTGAKGLNAAISDVAMLGAALSSYYAGDAGPLAGYSERALSRQWKTQYFSRWMTEMLHTTGTGAEAQSRYRGQVGQLDYVTGSRFALQALAEQYTGLPIEGI